MSDLELAQVPLILKLVADIRKRRIKTEALKLARAIFDFVFDTTGKTRRCNLNGVIRWMGFVIVRGDLIYLYLSEQVNLFCPKLLKVLTSLNLKAFWEFLARSSFLDFLTSLMDDIEEFCDLFDRNQVH